MLVFTNKIPDIADYNALRLSSGKGNAVTEERACKALNNSLYTISAYEDDRLIGFGRVIGDGGVSFAVTDIMVDKEFQLQGVGDSIMDHIDGYLDAEMDENSFAMLIARIPSNILYRKHGFNYLKEGYRIGMEKVK